MGRRWSLLHYFEGSADGVEDEGGEINKLTKMVGKKRKRQGLRRMEAMVSEEVLSGDYDLI